MLSPETLLDDVCGDDPQRVATALQAATGRGDELAPLIVARLEKTLVNPSLQSGEVYHYVGFLMFLAAEFHVTDAHVSLCAILRLDRDVVDGLVGDALTEGADCALAQTFGGDTAPLLGLVEDSAADAFARGAGLDALAKLWKRERFAREELLSLLSRLAQGLDPDEESDAEFADQLVDVAVQIGAAEIRDTILALYDRGLADPHFFEPEYTEEQLRPGVLPAHEARSLDRMIETAWEKGRRWYSFAPERAQAITRAAEIAVSEPPAAPLPAAERKPWTPPVPFRAPPKTGRNDPCPCGSGKKFKKCCGA